MTNSYMDILPDVPGYEQIQPLITAKNGGAAAPLNYTGLMNPDGYGAVYRNTENDTQLQVRDSVTDSEIFAVDDGETRIQTLHITGSLQVDQNLLVGGNLTVQGNSLLGNANTDTNTFVGITRIRNALNTATQLYVSPADNRVLIGSETALSSASDDKLSVIGGALHISSLTAVTPSLVQGWRFGTAGTTYGLWIDAATNPSLIFKDDGGIETFRLGDTSSAYQAEVGGNLNVTATANIAATVTSNRSVVGATTFSGSEKLRVTGGTTRLEDALTITANGANITGGIVLASSGNIDGNGGTAGQLRIGAVIVNAASLDGSEELLVNGQTRLKGATEVTTGGLLVSGGTASDTFTANGTGTVLSLSGSSQTQSTVGGAGGASALPATPRGYMKIVVGGNDRIIPYYDP